MPTTTSALRNKPTQTHGALLEPLGQNHYLYLAGVVATAAPSWSVDLYDEALGTATIIIMPENADDEFGPTYFVHREDGAFCLDQLHWDIYSAVGRFEDMHDVARAIRTKLLCQQSMAMSMSMTVH